MYMAYLCIVTILNSVPLHTLKREPNIITPFGNIVITNFYSVYRYVKSTQPV